MISTFSYPLSSYVTMVTASLQTSKYPPSLGVVVFPESLYMSILFFHCFISRDINEVQLSVTRSVLFSSLSSNTQMLSKVTQTVLSALVFGAPFLPSLPYHTLALCKLYFLPFCSPTTPFPPAPISRPPSTILPALFVIRRPYPVLCCHPRPLSPQLHPRL